jgi:glutathione S-transferase
MLSGKLRKGGAMLRGLFDLLVGGLTIATGIAVWLWTYRFFEEKYPPHDLRAAGPFKWQRRPAILAWIAAIGAALVLEMVLVQISN